MVIGVNTVKGGIEANGDASDDASQIGQGLATAFHGGAETVVETAERADGYKPGTSPVGKAVGVLGLPIAIWGASNDYRSIGDDWKNKGDTKLSNVLSAGSNTAGIVAGGVV